MGTWRAIMRRKAFRTFLRSFFLVFLIPLCLVVAVMARSITRTEHEMDTANQLLLEQFKSGVDSQLSSLTRVGASFIADERLLALAAMQHPLAHMSSSTTFAMLSTLLAEIRSVGIANEEVSLCYIYLQKSDKVLFGSVVDAEDFYARKLAATFETAEAWRAFLSQGRNAFFGLDGKQGREIGYMRSLPLGEGAGIVLVMMIDARSLLPFQAGDGAAVFAARSGEALYRVGLGEWFAPTADMLLSPSGAGVVELADSNARVRWQWSGLTGCTYFTFTSEAAYQGQLNVLRWLLAGLLVGALLLGALLCLYLAWRSYQPIRSLLAFAAGSPGAQDDDFRFLHQTFETLREEKLTIAQHLRHQRHTLRHSALERLLHGRYATVMAMEEDLLALDVGFLTDRFLVVGLFSDVMRRGEEGELLAFAVSNIFEELSRLAEFDVQAVVEEGRVILLLNGKDGLAVDVQQALAAALSQGMRLVDEHFDCALSIAASGLLQGYAGIHAGYLDVTETVRDERLMLLWTRQADQPTQEGWTLDDAQRFVNQLLVGDEDGVRQAVEVLREDCQGLSRWRRRMLIATAVQACGRAMLPARQVGDAQRKAIEKRMQALMESTQGDDFAALSELVHEICALQEPGSERGSELAERVQRYIETNYASPELGVAQIAEQLSLGASYASMLYKRETGESMLDAINRARLTQAKALLRAARLPNEEIARRVGYVSSATFNRAFKKYEGMTPGQYREHGAAM